MKAFSVLDWYFNYLGGTLREKSMGAERGMEKRDAAPVCCWMYGEGNSKSIADRPPTEFDLRRAVPNEACGRKATHRSKFGLYYCNMHAIKEDINLDEEIEHLKSFVAHDRDNLIGHETKEELVEQKVLFGTGAMRCAKVAGEAEYPLRYDLIPAGSLRRLAARYGMGSVKYGDDNYKKGIPTKNILNHVLAHLQRFMETDIEGKELDYDDDLAGAAWGIFTLMYFQMHGNPAEKSNAEKTL